MKLGLENSIGEVSKTIDNLKTENKKIEIQFFEKIPLKSFFFKDHENHDFEIQEFISPKDKLIF